MAPYSYLENSMDRGAWWAMLHGLQRVGKLHGLRVDSRIEEEGLDIYEHGESCYN